MSLLKRLRFRIVITAAGVACMVVAVAAAASCAYGALREAVGPVYASGLTALLFLLLAIGLLAFLHFEEEEEQQKSEITNRTKRAKWAGLAGEIAGAFLAGFAQRPRLR
jgi:hypothetical protein